MALLRVDFKVSLGNGRREFSTFTAVLLWERCQNAYIVDGFSSWKEVSSMCKGKFISLRMMYILGMGLPRDV
ncbi:unnamed protein product [Prunus armeniaca]